MNRNPPTSLLVRKKLIIHLTIRLLEQLFTDDYILPDTLDTLRRVHFNVRSLRDYHNRHL